MFYYFRLVLNYNFIRILCDYDYDSQIFALNIVKYIFLKLFRRLYTSKN